MGYTSFMIRFNFFFLTFILLAGCSSEEPVALEANSADQYREGVHYELLDNPTTVRDPSKIEVTEVFGLAATIAML